MKKAREKRITSLESALKNSKIDSLFVTNETNVTYLSGFEGHDSMLFLAGGKRYLITDSRYVEDASRSVKSFDVVLTERSVYETVKKLARETRVKKVGFESMDIPFEAASRLTEALGHIRAVPVKNMVESIRAIKDPGEVVSIQKAIALARAVLERTINSIKPGVKEEHLCRIIEIDFLEHDAEPSFDTIVASGVNTSQPHARPTGRKVSKNDMLMIDIGCKIDGYCSDLTRMVVVGKIEKKISRIYSIVSQAQEIAIGKITPGARISDIDASARAHIAEHGYGKCFGHALGHGVGMDIHEQPSISGNAHETLKPGMVFTVEPAIYVPGLGGVRIEDMVLVTPKGCRVLTR
ncbi:MAG: Xaa-Pro peptidase family protein [Candidatus Omnitrophota bacterium]|jgi:Xaa-Pro aminopeptidase